MDGNREQREAPSAGFTLFQLVGCVVVAAALTTLAVYLARYFE